jgi:inorganic triphosphatase YgiF
MTAPVREIELKFLLDRSDVDVLMAVLPPEETAVKAMVAIYFDTADGRLKRNGFGLRVRRTGAKRIQTLKSALGDDGGRDEWEWPVPTDAPDPALLLDTPAALPDEATLEPQVSVAVSRRMWIVRQGEAVIEVALDAGEVRAAGRREAVLELELELLSGPPVALAALADHLAARVSLTPSAVTKAERGFRLLGKT